MKNYLKITIYLVLSALNLGCSTHNDSLDIEQKIIEDIFPEIFNYAFEDYRKRPVPPPPPPSNDSNEELEKMQRAFEKAKEEHKIFLDTTNFAPLYVLVNDSVIGYSKKELRRIFNNKNNHVKFIDTTVYKKSFKIDLSQIDLGKDYIVTYKSDFDNTLDQLKAKDWSKFSKEEKHLWQFSGILYFNRIYFDKKSEYGFLDIGFNCGYLCGCGYRVFVKKVNDRWGIDKIEDLGCA